IGGDFPIPRHASRLIVAAPRGGDPLLNRQASAVLPQELLARVSHPNRYLGNALSAPRKPLDEAEVKVCLALADAYEIGMSHLGLRLLPHILNRRADCAAELCFAPWPDAERELRARGLPLFSLESGRPLTDFDVLGISLQYELHYTNVLNMLEL